mmetsp:Transcript_22079/g.57601  ORF Transcript_22079/g.57601 Transcript_22079/m.57601 type:complete len:203 (-) Transcript_22079:1727-2335(-)
MMVHVWLRSHQAAAARCWSGGAALEVGSLRAQMWALCAWKWRQTDGWVAFSQKDAKARGRRVEHAVRVEQMEAADGAPAAAAAAAAVDHDSAHHPAPAVSVAVNAAAVAASAAHFLVPDLYLYAAACAPVAVEAAAAAAHPGLAAPAAASAFLDVAAAAAAAGKMAELLFVADIAGGSSCVGGWAAMNAGMIPVVGMVAVGA